jgi:membrane protease YdiL (CAAX protease family)
MALTAFLQFVSLFVFRSLALSFLLYSLLGCVLIPLADLVLSRKLRLRDVPAALAIVPIGRRNAIMGLSIGLGFAGIMWGAFLLFGKAFLEGSAALDLVTAWGIPRNGLMYAYVAFLVLNGAIEEFYWRGYIHDKLKGEGKRWLAVGLPALVFGGQHYFVISGLLRNPVAIAVFMAAIVCTGVFWGIMRELAKSLFACMLSHALVAAGYMGILYAYVLA